MRNPAARGKADSNQRAIADAIRLLGYPVMDLSHAGNGVEDLLVGLYRRVFGKHPYIAFTPECWWILVECKVPPVRFTPGQRLWRDKTDGWPRITVTSAQDAVDQIRELTR